MTEELTILLISAVSVAFVHTLFGPDHYLPFIVMSRSGHWSKKKTIWITVMCGFGHVLSSVVLGFIGIGAGIAVSSLTIVESIRGGLAAWALIAFGLVYLIWGIRQLVKKRPHKHLHFHNDGTYHEHTHTHSADHAHVHQEKNKKSITPWVLFLIFILGPCEPLIPLFMYPAAQSSITGVILVSLVFALTTIITMLGIVLLALSGIDFVPLRRIERFSHVLAGATVLLCGVAIRFLGL